jgi:hypothetical protein
MFPSDFVRGYGFVLGVRVFKKGRKAGKLEDLKS